MSESIENLPEIIIRDQLQKLDKGQSVALMSAIFQKLRGWREQDATESSLLESNTEIRVENDQKFSSLSDDLFPSDFSEMFKSYVNQSARPGDGIGSRGTISLSSVFQTLEWNVRLSNAKAKKDRIRTDVEKVRRSIENLILNVRGDNSLMSDDEFQKEWATRFIQVLRTLAFELEQEFIGIEPVREASAGMSWFKKRFSKAMNKATESALEGAINEAGDLLQDLPEVLELHRMLPEL